MGDLSRFDTAENFLCNKLSFQGFQGFPLKKYLFFKVLKATWSDFKVFKVRQPPSSNYFYITLRASSGNQVFVLILHYFISVYNLINAVHERCYT